MAEEVIIITGAARGIGRAIVERLAHRPATKLALIDIIDSNFAGHLCIKADLSNVEKLPALADEVENKFGPITGLVNNAGIIKTMPLLDVTPTDWEQHVAVNARAPFFLMQHCGRRMAARKVGSIVNISSVAARSGRPTQAVYAATKAMVISLTRSAAMEFGPAGVRVNAVCPGVVETEMTQSIFKSRAQEETDALLKRIPLGRIAAADEIAAAVEFLLSPAASYVNGQALNVCGGLEQD